MSDEILNSCQNIFFTFLSVYLFNDLVEKTNRLIAISNVERIVLESPKTNSKIKSNDNANANVSIILIHKPYIPTPDNLQISSQYRYGWEALTRVFTFWLRFFVFSKSRTSINRLKIECLYYEISKDYCNIDVITR